MAIIEDMNENPHPPYFFGTSIPINYKITKKNISHNQMLNPLLLHYRIGLKGGLNPFLPFHPFPLLLVQFLLLQIALLQTQISFTCA